MPCDDCVRMIAQLQAEVDLLRAAFERRQEMILDKQDAVLDKMDRTIDTLKATQQTMFADVKRLVRETMARLEAALRMPAPPPAREDPPRWQ